MGGGRAREGTRSTSIAAALLMILLVPATPGALPTPSLGGLGQDDAGSGADAPDHSHEGLRLPLGTYEGALDPTPGVPGARLGDNEDWYRFHLEAGERVTLEIESLATGADPVTYQPLLIAELRTPAGEIATASRDLFDDAPAWTITDRPGWWAVRISPDRRIETLWWGNNGGNYRFTIDAMPAAPGSMAGLGPGYVFVGYTLTPTTEQRVVRYAITATYAASPTDWTETLAVTYERDPDGGLQAFEGGQAPSGNPSDVALHVGGATTTIRVALEASDIEVVRAERTWLPPPELPVPLTRHVGYTIHAPEAYLAAEPVAPGPGVVSHGVSLGGPARHHDLSLESFSGTAGVEAGELRAAVALGRELTIEHRLQGRFCPGSLVTSCRVTDPNGQEHTGHQRWTDGAAGLWRFEIEHHVGTGVPSYGVVYDLELPDDELWS